MRKKIENIILVITLFLGMLSIVMVLSSTINSADFQTLYIKQTFAVFIGVAIMFILRSFPYKILEELSPLFYFVSVLLLIGVLVFGVEIHGGRRWFNFGVFHFQVVEFVKFSMIMFLALIIGKYNRLLYAFIPTVIVMALVTVQPDAGSAILFIPVLAMMLEVAPVNTNWMVIALPYAGIAVVTLFLESYLSVKSLSLLNLKYMLYPLIASVIIYFIFMEARKVLKYLNLKYLLWLIFLFWISSGAGILGSNFLKMYQKKRIISFMIPELYPLGVGYNIRQSLLAIGSGRIFGKGLFGGTQTQLGFLPVRHTDFIFATISEELGIWGAIAILSFIGILLWQILRIMERTEDLSGRLIAGGIFALIFAQVVLNTGVTLGLLPVIGVQFPLVSYGGTGMVLFMALIGVLLNINRRTEIIGR